MSLNVSGKQVRGVPPKANRTQSAKTLSNANKSNSLSKSVNFSASKSLAQTNTSLENIEAEYIKNLQQQIYFLELETNYLREQAKRATDIQPKMVGEADKMQLQLRTLQTEVDNLNLEVRRKQAHVDLVESEKANILSRLHSTEDAKGEEKKNLVGDVVHTKKELENTNFALSTRTRELMEAKSDIDKNLGVISRQDARIFNLEHELLRKTEEARSIQTQLEESRAETSRVENKLRNLETEYYTNTAKMQEEITKDLRDEIRVLRQQLKETELKLDQDRYLKNKIENDSTGLARENGILQCRVDELSKMLEKERHLREGQENRYTVNSQELMTLKTKEQNLEWELNQARELLEMERQRIRDLSEKVSSTEHSLNVSRLNAASYEKELLSLKDEYSHSQSDGAQLKRDKTLLVDHVAELLKKLESTENDNKLLHRSAHFLEDQLKEHEKLAATNAELQSRKWSEFGSVAGSLKDLTTNMSELSRTNREDLLSSRTFSQTGGCASCKAAISQ